MHSLSTEYAEYREYAEAEVSALGDRIMDTDVKLIEMKNTCNALLPVQPDAGNDQSEPKPWTCTRVKWCEHVDWRYHTASEVCIFEEVIEYSDTKPDPDGYGGYCYGN